MNWDVLFGKVTKKNPRKSYCGIKISNWNVSEGKHGPWDRQRGVTAACVHSGNIPYSKVAMEVGREMIFFLNLWVKIKVDGERTAVFYEVYEQNLYEMKSFSRQQILKLVEESLKAILILIEKLS